MSEAARREPYWIAGVSLPTVLPLAVGEEDVVEFGFLAATKPRERGRRRYATMKGEVLYANSTVEAEDEAYMFARISRCDVQPAITLAGVFDPG
jgi:hypothetical protein